jgi:hypothetical protein
MLIGHCDGYTPSAFEELRSLKLAVRCLKYELKKPKSISSEVPFVEEDQNGDDIEHISIKKAKIAKHLQ